MLSTWLVQERPNNWGSDQKPPATSPEEAIQHLNAAYVACATLDRAHFENPTVRKAGTDALMKLHAILDAVAFQGSLINRATIEDSDSDESMYTDSAPSVRPALLPTPQPSTVDGRDTRSSSTCLKPA